MVCVYVCDDVRALFLFTVSPAVQSGSHIDCSTGSTGSDSGNTAATAAHTGEKHHASIKRQLNNKL